MKEDNTLWYDKVINEAIKNNESSKLAAPQQETSKEDSESPQKLRQRKEALSFLKKRLSVTRTTLS